MTARFLDAVRAAAPGAREVVILGPGLSCPLDELIEALPRARFTLVDRISSVGGYYTHPQARVVLGDGAEIARYDDRHYDLILCRHPDIDKHEDGWRRVFGAVWRVMVVGGTLLVSTYTRAERERVQHVLAEGRFKIRSELKSEVPVALSGADRYILWYNYFKQE